MSSLLKFLHLPSFNLQLSRNTKLLLGLLAGVSVSILAAGYLLNRRRRRYRAVTTSSDHTSSLQRQGTLASEPPTPFCSTSTAPRYSGFSRKRLGLATPLSPESLSSFPSVSSEHPPPVEEQNRSSEEEEEEFVETTDVPFGWEEPLSTDKDIGGMDDAEGRKSSLSGSESVTSEDSFHSTVESIDLYTPLTLDRNQFYHTGMDCVNRGVVKCRTIRTEMLGCSSDADFLAKLYCVRLALHDLVQSSANREYFRQAGRDLMASLFSGANRDPSLFCERFDELTHFLEDDSHWGVIEEELRSRRVVCMNIYDIAMDFVLMDAFSDLDNPPSTVVAVLQNKWITEGMKRSALSAAMWSILKAKKSMLKHKDGFMARFYLLSETLSPLMVWGFLGTDDTLREQCNQFKSTILKLLRSIFSLEEVRYTTVHTLADDILYLAQHTAETMVVT